MTRLYAHDGGGDYFYVDKKEVTTHLDFSRIINQLFEQGKSIRMVLNPNGYNEIWHLIVKIVLYL